jgi:secreted PhoX family phosphatase
MLSVMDSSAEPTGFLFDASGTTAYVSIQHSNDANMPAIDGYPTDDVLKITGFKLRGKKDGWQWW